MEWVSQEVCYSRSQLSLETTVFVRQYQKMKKLISFGIFFLISSLYVLEGVKAEETLSDLMATPRDKAAIRLYENVGGSIKRREFYKRFRDNKNLKRSDLRSFPKEIRRKLQYHQNWEKNHYVGFSKYITGVGILFVVQTNYLSNYISSALIIPRRSQTWPITPKSNISWNKLMLVDLRFNGEISVSDRFRWLDWNDHMRAIISKTCTDMVSKERPNCARYHHKIYANSSSSLIKIDADFYNKKTKRRNWKPLWEKGKWTDAAAPYLYE